MADRTQRVDLTLHLVPSPHNNQRFPQVHAMIHLITVNRGHAVANVKKILLICTSIAKKAVIDAFQFLVLIPVHTVTTGLELENVDQTLPI